MVQIFHLFSIIQFNIFSVKEVPNRLVEINVTLEIQTKNKSSSIPIRDYDLGKSLNDRSYCLFIKMYKSTQLIIK